MIENRFISESNEQALIYCILNNDDYLLEVIETFKDITFGRAPTRNIFNAITKCFSFNKKIIRENIISYLSSDDITYLDAIINSDFDISNFRNYYENVRDKFLLREAHELIMRAKDDINSKGGTELLEELQGGIDKLFLNSTKNTTLFGDNLFDIIPDPDKYSPEDKKDYIGYTTGIDELNEITLGLNGGSYNIIAGRPSTAKTLLTRYILLANVVNEVPVMFFSLDEPEQIIKLKTISTITGINYNHLKRQELNAQELKALKNNIDFIKTMPFLIDTTPNLTVNMIRSKIKKAKYRYPNLGVVAIDYVQQLSGQGNSIYEKNSYISSELKNLCFEFDDIAFIIISQLSRSIETRAKEDKNSKWWEAPMLSDIRDAGTYEADADRVFFIVAEPPKGEDGFFKERRDTRLWISKQRDGAVGMAIKMYTIGKYQTIEVYN